MLCIHLSQLRCSLPVERRHGKQDRPWDKSLRLFQSMIFQSFFLPQIKTEESILHNVNVPRKTRTAQEGYANSKRQRRGEFLTLILDIAFRFDMNVKSTVSKDSAVNFLVSFKDSFVHTS